MSQFNLDHGFLLLDWRVDPSLNRLTQAEREVNIEPQAMDILVLLANQQGAVVSSEEIVRVVWEGRAVSDNPVYKAMTKLRRALGDHKSDPKYIETVTKRGYRLIAPVSALPPADASPAAGDLQGGLTGRTARLALLGAIALVVALVAVVTLIRPGPSAREPQLSRDPNFRQLVTLPGSSSDPSYDPTGTSLAFVHDNGAGASIWRLDLSSRVPEQLTEGPADTSPTWSPEGDRLLFVRGGEIWQLAFGSNPELLIEKAISPAWSFDATSIAFERGTEVWLAGADGLNQRRVDAISSREQTFGPRGPSFSPDGRSLVYLKTVEGPLGDFWLLDLETEESRQLTFSTALAGHPQFSADGQWIVFHSTRRGSEGLWRVSPDGGEPEPLVHSTSNDRSATISPDGHSVAYTSTRPRWSLVLTAPGGETEVLFESRTAALAPQLSPDESELAFFAPESEGEVHIYVLPLSGPPARALTDGPSANAMPKWSVDGKWVYHYHFGEEDAWRRVHRDGGEPEVLASGWRFNREHDAAMHPDGTRAIYARLEGDEVLATRIRDLETGADLPFFRKVSWPEWSPNGASLLATDFSATPVPVGPIVHCELEGTQAGQCVELAPRGQHPRWTPDGRGAYFVNPVDPSTLELWFCDLREGSRRLVMTLGPVADIGPFFDVTADGRIVWVRYEEGPSELWQATW